MLLLSSIPATHRDELGCAVQCGVETPFFDVNLLQGHDGVGHHLRVFVTQHLFHRGHHRCQHGNQYYMADAVTRCMCSAQIT